MGAEPPLVADGPKNPWHNQGVLKGFVLMVLLALALFAAARANRRRALPPGRFVAEADKKPEPGRR